MGTASLLDSMEASSTLRVLVTSDWMDLRLLTLTGTTCS